MLFRQGQQHIKCQPLRLQPEVTTIFFQLVLDEHPGGHVAALNSLGNAHQDKPIQPKEQSAH